MALKRGWMHVVPALLVGMAMVGPVGHTEAASAPPKRIAVSESVAKKMWLRPKNRLPDGRVTVTVSSYQLAQLDKDRTAYEEIPTRSVNGIDWACWFSKKCDPWGGSTSSGSGSGNPSGSKPSGGIDWACWFSKKCDPWGGAGPSSPGSTTPGGSSGPATSVTSPSSVYRPPKAGTKPKRMYPPTTQIPFGIRVVYGDEWLYPGAVRGGAGVTVAVLDTGYYAHQDFLRPDGTKVITGCKDYLSTSSVVSSCQDYNGHGTHLAGIIAAAAGTDGQGIIGVAPEATILSYRVLDRYGVGYADDVAQAIRDAADAGANIILMAFSGAEDSDLERQAVTYAVSKGSLLIASAGPLVGGAQVQYPAKYGDVTSVGPSDLGYFGVGQREQADLNGPGHMVLSTATNGKYTSMTGTSQAAAHVAGLAAKVWQGNSAATRGHLLRLAQQGGMDAVPQIQPATLFYQP